MNSLQLIIPLGTQIVSRLEVKTAQGESLCPVGAVGIIVKAPTDNAHSYRVQFTNGVEVALHRNEFSIRKHHTSADSVMEENALYEFVILRVIVGSRAYGLDHAESDTDRRGIYLPPADVHWSMFGVPEQIENKDNEECYWELQKFLVLAGNRKNARPSRLIVPDKSSSLNGSLMAPEAANGARFCVLRTRAKCSAGSGKPSQALLHWVHAFWLTPDWH